MLDRTDPASSPLFSEAATRHIITLGLEQAHEVHEQDQMAVEDLISNMQRSRVFYSAWGYSSITSLLTRKIPHYRAERAIIIKGGVMQGAKPNTIASASQQPSQSSLQLSGETGLSFARESRGTLNTSRTLLTTLLLLLFAQSWLCFKSARSLASSRPRLISPCRMAREELEPVRSNASLSATRPQTFIVCNRHALPCGDHSTVCFSSSTGARKLRVQR